MSGKFCVHAAARRPERSRTATVHSLLLCALCGWVAGWLSGCGSDPQQHPFVVEGRVVRAEDGHAVAEARVVLITDTFAELRTRSDDRGRFTLRVGPHESFGQLRATQPDGATIRLRASERTLYFDTPTQRIDLQMRTAEAVSIDAPEDPNASVR